MSYVTRLPTRLRSRRSEPKLHTGNEQVVGLAPQAHRRGIRRQVRGKRFAERVLRGIKVEVHGSANRSRFGATSPFRPALNCIAKAVADASGPESK